MTVQLLAFAHLPTQLGFQEQMLECSASETPREIMRRVAPDLDLSTIRVALDQEYTSWDEPIGSALAIALIPPVSGG